MQALERLNDEADRIDARNIRDITRRAERAQALLARCAPWQKVNELEGQLPEPIPIVGLSVLACSILAIVEYFVRLGYDGAQVARKDLAWLHAPCSDSSVVRALRELKAEGWLVPVPSYVRAEESALGVPRYVSSTGKHRSQPSDDPDAYDKSRVRNLYRLGSKAHAAGLGKRCGQVGELECDTAGDTAIVSASDSGSGSDSGSASPDRRRPCGFVDNPPVGPEIEGSAPSARSTFCPSEGDGVSELSATRATDTTAPPVADETLAVIDVDGGDARGIEGGQSESRRRGLFGAMGWRVSRFFAGGRS